MATPEQLNLIPRNLGGTENLYENLPFVGSVEFQDGLIASMPVIGFLFLSGIIIPDAYSQFRLVLVGIGAMASLIALLVKPNYLTLTEFLQLQREYRSKPKEFSKSLDKSIETVRVNEDSDTRTKLGINKIYPEYNVVEREDGVMVSVVEVSGVDIDVLGMEGDWNSYATELMNIMTGQVEEDIQFFMPMRQYDPSAQASRLDSRLDDPRIADDALLAQYARDRIQFHRAMAERAFYRKYYIIVKTNPSEVVSKSDYQQTGMVAILDNFPVVGEGLKGIYMGLKNIQFGMLSDRELTYKQLDLANEKAAQYRSIFDGVAGNAWVLTGNEIGIILKEFWEGVSISEDQKENYLREQPYVLGPEDLNDEGGE